MRLQRVLCLGLLGVALSGPAQAGDRFLLSAVEPEPDLRVLFGGILTEDDVGLLFAHLRAAMIATAEGREPPPLPEGLAKRLEAAGGELRLRGLLAGVVLTQFVERAVREAVRELAPPPPPRGGI